MENLIWKLKKFNIHWFKLWIWPSKLTLCGWKKLRMYFLQCLQDECITPFPSTQIKRKLLLQSVNIYCKCRLPYIFKHKKLVNQVLTHRWQRCMLHYTWKVVDLWWLLKSLIYFQMTVTRMMVYVLGIAGRMNNYGVYIGVLC